MAEAVVEDHPTQKFYCHMCNVQFENASMNFTCPHCSDGFVEMLQDATTSTSSSADYDGIMNDNFDGDGVVVSDIRLAPLLLTSRQEQLSRRPENSNRTGRRSLTRLASSNLRQNNVPFDNLIQDFIINLGTGLSSWGTSGNMHLLLRNPGDYAWGREGLDAIVTQLLNQIDTTGPPPVSRDVIDALPMVEVTPDQVLAKIKCSVCWESFVVNESVRQLPCYHIYHDPCIRPWLEIHGTCPICRQILITNEQNSTDSDQDSGGPSSGRN